MDEFAAALAYTHPPLSTALPEEDSGIITDLLFGHLRSDFEDRLTSQIRLAGRTDLIERMDQLRSNDREFRRIVLQLGAAFLPDEVRQYVGIMPANPPADVHCMVREEFFAGDFYFSDMVANALQEAGLETLHSGVYLDFGGSSGRVVRTLQAAYPIATWCCCDPQATSIAWARDNLDPRLEFFVSPLSPPMASGLAARFDGIFAVSIWSHFSESAALAWFDEMHRCLKPGGWLMFTAHGPNTLCHYARNGLKVEADIRLLHDRLMRDGYVFEDVFGPAGDWGVPASDWGSCYFLPSWIALHLVGSKWSLRGYKVGRAALDQDIYVLTRNRSV